jgi:putative colanic acid biosynthesis acetyltransferase WcaF
MKQVDLSQFQSNLSWGNRLTRALWGGIWLFLFRPSPRIAFAWRAALLRMFGARIGRGVRVYNSARVFLPANLRIEDRVVIGPDVDLYCVAPIRIERDAMISQYSYLCAATHDYRQPHLPLVPLPIVVGAEAWVCAAAFVGPGVTVGSRAIVGARAAVFKDIPAGHIVGGNPAKFLKLRDGEVQP